MILGDMMSNHANLRGLSLALAIVGTISCSGVLRAQTSPATAKSANDNSRSLANGVYAVLREGRTSGEVQIGEFPHVILIYDRKYSDGDKNQPPIYVALGTSSFVPLVLAGPPWAHKDDRGWTSLNVTLAREHVKTLENFTRTHLGGTVAIVIDGEIITMHKVRTVIQDGKAQITRCTDDACETLRLKLTN
jgi:hypothetical protein